MERETFKEDRIDVILLLLIFLFGWLGIDKLYSLGFKQGWKLFVIKFLANFIFIGELWNILDFIMALFKRYEADPREYLQQIEDNNTKSKR